MRGPCRRVASGGSRGSVEPLIFVKKFFLRVRGIFLCEGCWCCS